MSDVSELPSITDQFLPSIRQFVEKNNSSRYERYSEDWRARMDRINSALSWIMANIDEYKKNCTIGWNVQVTEIHECIAVIETETPGEKFYVALNKLMKSTFLLVYEKTLRTSFKDGDIDNSNRNEFPLISLLLEQEANITSKERLLARQWAFGLQRAIHQSDIEKNESIVNAVSQQAIDTKDKAETAMSQWETKIKECDDKVILIEERVEGIAGKQNFVALAKAFNRLVETKEKELKGVNSRLFWMGVAVLVPLVLSLGLTALIWLLHANPAAELKDKIIYFAPVIIPLEVVLVYFFRIILKEQLSLKGQILQLELRYGVCEFIKGYADFVKTVGENKLDKFEALIFSGITPDPTAVPGTFDGMEQLLNLAKAAGGK